MAPEAAAPKKYAFRQRYTKHNYSLLEGDADEEESDDDEVVTPAMTAATAAGLDASVMSLMEERDFAHVTKGGSGKTAQYLSVRCARARNPKPDRRERTTERNNKKIKNGVNTLVSLLPSLARSHRSACPLPPPSPPF